MFLNFCKFTFQHTGGKKVGERDVPAGKKDGEQKNSSNHLKTKIN